MRCDAKNIFKTLSFFNTYTDKSEIKKLSNVKLLQTGAPILQLIKYCKKFKCI